MDDVQLRFEPFPSDALQRFVIDSVTGHNFAPPA